MAANERQFLITLKYDNGAMPDREWLEAAVNELMRRAIDEGSLQEEQDQDGSIAVLEDIDVQPA